MKTKQERINDSIKRVGILKDAAVSRYTDEIEYNEPLSHYDVMMEHFVKGDLDDVFLTDAAVGMSDKERRELFDLVREYNGLVFAKGDVDYWIDSLENTFVADFDMIAYTIFDCYDYLLELAKVGGRKVLDQLTALREHDELRDVAIIEYLRNTFIDDRALSAIVLEMSEEDSLYSVFSNEQKGILLNYPEGTLYSYGNGNINITSPLVLAARLYNDYNADLTGELIGEIDENNLDESLNILSDFLKDNSFDFYDAILGLSDRYRDYFRRSDVILNDEAMAIVYDDDSEGIQDAWDNGDEFLGGTFDTPYTGGSK